MFLNFLSFFKQSNKLTKLIFFYKKSIIKEGQKLLCFTIIIAITMITFCQVSCNKKSEKVLDIFKKEFKADIAVFNGKYRFSGTLFVSKASENEGRSFIFTFLKPRRIEGLKILKDNCGNVSLLYHDIEKALSKEDKNVYLVFEEIFLSFSINEEILEIKKSSKNICSSHPINKILEVITPNYFLYFNGENNMPIKIFIKSQEISILISCFDTK